MILTMTWFYEKVLENKLEEDIDDKVVHELAGFSACLDHIYALQQ